MADTNPGNFANRPKEEVQAIASMGGKAAHEKAEHAKEADAEAAQAGHLGGLHAAGKEDSHPGRREDGTFLPGSEAAKEAGHKGGETHAAHVAADK